jgi:hypothetical protein
MPCVNYLPSLQDGEVEEYEEEGPPSDYDNTGVLTTSRVNFQDLRIMAKSKPPAPAPTSLPEGESTVTKIPRPLPGPPARASSEEADRLRQRAEGGAGQRAAPEKPVARLSMIPRVLRQVGDRAASTAGDCQNQLPSSTPLHLHIMYLCSCAGESRVMTSNLLTR